MNKRDAYLHTIDTLGKEIQKVELVIQKGFIDILALKEKLLEILDDNFKGNVIKSLSQLSKYYQGIDFFLSQYGNQDVKKQIGRLFSFRDDKLFGKIDLEIKGPVIQITFDNSQDFLSVKYAMRKGNFSQDDRSSGFFKVLRLEEYDIPVCVSLCQYQKEIMLHEMTHFRNSIIGMDYYRSGGGRDIYEQVVYDDLQEEILAFFSEGIGRADIQMAIMNDQRYFFYRRIEDTSNPLRQARFNQDVSRFINTAREIKAMRPESYIYDLSLIPLGKWEQYRRFLKKSGLKITE